MNIQKAIKEAMDCDGSFFRKATMCKEDDIRIVIKPAFSNETCTIVSLMNGIPVRSSKDWNPSIEDLITDDWIVLNENIMAEKDVIRENSKGVEDIDVHKMTIQEAAKAAVGCNGGLYRKITRYEASGRYIVVTPVSERLPAPVVVITNGVPIYSCRFWAPTADDLIADDWIILNSVEF